MTITLSNALNLQYVVVQQLCRTIQYVRAKAANFQSVKQ
jgi:hypothetical protein